MLIKVTQQNDKPMYVRASAIIAFDEVAEGGGSRLIFDNDFAYLVKETPEQIKKCIMKCCGSRVKVS